MNIRLSSLRALVLRSSCALATLSLLAAPAVAQEAPSDEELLGSKVVGVQPILAIGASEEAAWDSVAQAVNLAEKGDAIQDLAPDALKEPSGFGFAGSSSASDIAVLHFATALGRLPAAAAAGQTDAVKKMAGYLQARKKAMTASLSPEARAAVTAILGDASRGKVEGRNFARALKAAQDGMYAGKPRPHGYLATGLWTGLAMIAAGTPDSRDPIARMAGPLITLLEEDASFGGSDRKVAKVVKEISSHLDSRNPKASKVDRLSLTLLDVTPDK